MSETAVIERDTKTGRFVAGNSGGGRPVGSRNKLGEQFLSDLSEAWKTHGKAALVACAQDSPDKFCKIVADLLPRQAELDVTISGLERGEMLDALGKRYGEECMNILRDMLGEPPTITARFERLASERKVDESSAELTAALAKD
jgi:hypothetical protein